MGNIIKNFDSICSDCAKYVCNSMTFHSNCCDNIEIDCQTHEIEIKDSESEISIEIQNCASLHKKIKKMKSLFIK